MKLKELKRVDEYLNNLIEMKAEIFRSEVIENLEKLGIMDDEMLHREYEAEDNIYFNQICENEEQAIYTINYKTIEECKFEDEEDNALITITSYETRIA